MIKIQRYGWKRDIPDHRDVLYKNVRREAPKKLPPKADLRSGCSPVEDQGNIGSCTAQALVGALEFLEVKAGCKYQELSRLFVYYNERVLEHSVNYDSGAQIRDGIKVLASQGVCQEAIWPYNTFKFNRKPPAVCYTDALDHKIASYYRVTSLAQLKQSLAAGYPVTFGFTVYESFETERVAKTGIMPMPKADEEAVGGHAVLAVGYDDTKDFVIVRNSWGSKWGVKGYFFMPYAYISNPYLANDFWTVRVIEGYNCK
jgi:C1A family cysteine protease